MVVRSFSFGERTMKKGMGIAVPDVIERKIILLRGQKVILDSHIAELYGVETNDLKRAVRRNKERFPDDFMLQLTLEEYDSLRRQFGALKRGEHSKYLPSAFTEQGIAMLSGVLRSRRNWNKWAVPVFHELQLVDRGGGSAPQPQTGFSPKREDRGYDWCTSSTS
jgi:hypothetical protein